MRRERPALQLPEWRRCHTNAEETGWQIAGEAEELRRSIKETWAYSRNLILRARLLLG